MSNDESKRRAPGRSMSRGLGRGLGALIVNTEPSEAQPQEADGEHQIDLAAQPGSDALRSLAVTRIRPNPNQPRTHFDPGALNELAASIREHGIIQPLIVTESPEQAGHYWLIAGERRWRAAQLAELQTVPVTVREVTPQQRLEWALVENIQRADLNALEEAAAYHTLIEDFGLTQADVGRRVGKSRSAVANTLRLLQLPEPVQAALLEETISPGHARTLLALADETVILDVLNRILNHSLSVRQTEELVRRLLTQPLPVVPEPEAETDEAAQSHLAFLENRLRNALGTKVNLSRNRDGSGRLVVHFYSDEDLTGIYELIAGSSEDIE